MYPYNLFLGDKHRKATTVLLPDPGEGEAEATGERERSRDDGKGRRRRRRRPERVDAQEAEFEVLEDNLEPEEAKQLLSEDDHFRYGSYDPSVPASTVPCGGCGAILHCREGDQPEPFPTYFQTQLGCFPFL